MSFLILPLNDSPCKRNRQPSSNGGFQECESFTFACQNKILTLLFANNGGFQECESFTFACQNKILTLLFANNGEVSHD